MEKISSAPAVLPRPRGVVGHRVRRFLRLLVVVAVVALLIPSDGHLGASRTDFAIDRTVSGKEFDLAAWEAQALAQKARDVIAKPGDGFSPEQERNTVSREPCTDSQPRRACNSCGNTSPDGPRNE